MPQPRGGRGGWHATFTGFTTGGERPSTCRPPCAAVIDYVPACLNGHAGNLIEPASALPALELTPDVHQRLTQTAR